METLSTTTTISSFGKDLKPEAEKRNLKVVAHRGGFQPENSKACFMRAFEEKVDGIELDVWMSIDGTLFICHPGDCGQIEMSSGKEELFQNQKDEEILKITLNDGSCLPTLDWLVETSIQFPETELHIELKNPQDEELNQLYDIKKVVRITLAMLLRHQCLEKSHILSFDTRIIEEVRNQRGNLNMKAVQLYNFYDNIPLPADRNEWIANETISISAFHVTKEVVTFCHENQTKVCVWIDTVSGNVVEGEEHYRNMISLGVDYIVTDFPLKAKSFIVQESAAIAAMKKPQTKKTLGHQVSNLSINSVSTAGVSQYSASFFSKGEKGNSSSSSLNYEPAL